MNRYPHFMRWLGIAALLDWLVTRTLARGAIFSGAAKRKLEALRARKKGA